MHALCFFSTSSFALPLLSELKKTKAIYLNYFGEDLSKSEGEGIGFPLQKTVSLLSSF